MSATKNASATSGPPVDPAAVDAARADWVRRVLGVAMPSQSGQAPAADVMKEFGAAHAAWSDAMAAVDRQMATLKVALLASGDVEYEEIAEQQLATVLGGGPRQLSALLQKTGGGDAAHLRAGAAAALVLLTSVLKDLQSNPAVAVCEANPVRAPVAIRATLGPPIARLRTVLSQASGP